MNTKARIYQELLERLRAYSPDYAEIERMGAKVLPHLKQIIETEDPLSAGKAAYVATRMWSTRTPSVIRAATERKEPEIHVAALSGARSVALRKGKFEKRRASHKQSRFLTRFAASMRENLDSGIKRIAANATSAFLSSKPKPKRKKADKKAKTESTEESASKGKRLQKKKRAPSTKPEAHI